MDGTKKIKEKSPLEYFQLAQGLYLGKKRDGSKEVFRDLWINSSSFLNQKIGDSYFIKVVIHI